MTGTLAAIRTRRDRGRPNQRRTPRFHLEAAVEVRDLDSGAVLVGQVGQIGIYGCYVKVANPLPRGTRLSIKISTAGELFETVAVVVECDSNEGMGLAFREVSHLFLPTLHRWLLSAMRAGPAKPETR